MVQPRALDDARASAVRRAGETTLRMSERLWALQWPSWTFGGISVEPGTFEEAAPFIADHYPTIFATEPNRFLEEKMTDAKRRFLAECDVFLFRADAQDVAIGIGHPTDWATYYIRTFALLPQYRDRGVVKEFVEQVAAAVRAVGVELIEFDTSPGNVPMNRAFLRLGCVVTGSLNTDRWGTLLRYTMHLTPESGRVFKSQFMIVPAFGRQADVNPLKKEEGAR